MPSTTLPAIGTVVTIDDPRCVGLYKVTAHGPKNATLQPCNADGTVRAGRGARMPGYMLQPYDPAAPAPAPWYEGPIFDVGSLCTTRTTPGTFVVIADKGEKVNIVRLGGDAGRYYRVPRAAVTPLPLADLKDRL